MGGSGRPAQTSRVVLPRRGFLLLILLTVFWGANWPEICSYYMLDPLASVELHWGLVANFPF